MKYWLIKSEPSVYSWDKFLKDKSTHWSGVRNYQAANNMRAMKKGDRAFFYHSNEGKEIIGIAEITKESYPDPSDESGKFVMVDVKPVAALKKPVTLAMMKMEEQLRDFGLIRQSRLSVVPVAANEWKKICQMGETKI